ncbi:SET and MYND domain-containing protein 4-like isoform X2 [Anoplophora glabripennis]|nr:SET and MYND domain-containing protein 4-like isoform X2 [Anoplophora glabripennis]
MLPMTDVLSNVQEIYRRKSAEVSEAKRLEAEKATKEGDLQKALLLYSQSVLRAPKTGLYTKMEASPLSLALWGRAQILLSQKEHSLALSDMQLALKEGLPIAYKGKSFWKMAVCYKALNEENRANVAFALAEKLLGSKLNKEELERDRTASYVERKKENRRFLPSIEGQPHSTFPCASKKLSVRHKEGVGRYVVANETVKTGETLVVEPPYAACLLPEMFGTHCHHCFDRLVSPIGCLDCSNVAFCNQACQEAALSTYHKYECKFLDLLLGSGMSILSHTALRMITQIELSKCLEIYKDRSREKVYSLCTNASIRPAEDFLQRTLMAAFLLRCLQKSGYFGRGDRNRIAPTEEEYCIGELLLFHLQMLQFNAHEIYETRNAGERGFKRSKVVYIGVAVYPTVALFNHDCYPAVTRHFVGKQIVIKASRPLQPDDVVAENYGPIFTRKCLKERQRSLSSRYWFDCQCKACTFNWPTLDTGLEDYSKRIRCTNKNCSFFFTLPISNDVVKCPKCKETVALTENLRLLKWCEGQYDEAAKALSSNDPEKATQILCSALDTFHRISLAPHKATHLAEQMLQLCVASTGNVSSTLMRK